MIVAELKGKSSKTRIETDKYAELYGWDKGLKGKSSKTRIETYDTFLKTCVWHPRLKGKSSKTRIETSGCNNNLIDGNTFEREIQ